MQQTITVIDDFHPLAKTITRVAKTLNYSEPINYAGHTYHGMSQEYEPELYKETLEVGLARDVLIKQWYFRLGTKTGNEPTTHIHADSICAQYAAVWYLSKPPAGVEAGTAFWKHIQFAIESTPTLVELQKIWPQEDQKISGYADRFLDQINKDGGDESKWVRTVLIPQKFNRLVIYPTKLFHSRFPRDAWGDGTADGRLIHVSFFDIL